MKQPRPLPLRTPAPPTPAPGFSLVELLVVIAIIGILAALLVGLAPAAMQKARESRVRTELKGIEAAIEGYKAKLGVYPPDGLVLDGNTPRRDSAGNLVVRPELNPLYYELTGVVVTNELNAASGYFIPLGDEEAATPTRILPQDLRTYFGRDGFVNAATQARKRSLYRSIFKDYASAGIFSAKAGGQEVNLRVLAVGWAGDAERPKGGTGLVWPLRSAFPNPVPSNPRLNPWRYVSSNPTNNPGRFDLWAEYVEKGQLKIIGNWKR